MGAQAAAGYGAEGYVVEAGRPARGRLRTLWRWRGLLWSFTLREVQVRYRQAALGVAWALLQPAALALITTAVFHHVLRLEAGGRPYPVFVLGGLVAWTYLHGAVTGAVPSLVQGAGLVRKIWFPREVLPLAVVLAVGLDLAIGLALWIALLPAFGVVPTAHALWALPLLLVLAAFTAALALVGAAVNVRFRDVKHALPLLLQVLFFATPIVYPLALVPSAWRDVVGAQPLAAVVVGLREAVLEGHAPDPTRTALAAAIAFVLLAGAYLWFLRAERRFADIV